MKRILVTGGLGFIGFTLVQKLLSDPLNEVIVIDNLSAGELDTDVKLAIKAYPDRLMVVTGDLRTIETYPEVDEVYHLAAHIGTKTEFDQPLNVLNDNISLMQTILAIYGLRETKIVYSSSIEVFTGREQKTPTNEDCPIGWDNPRDPRWAYSFSKFVAEMYLTSSPAHWAVARFSNVYGPRMCHDYVVKALFNRIKSGENPLKVFAPSDTRPFIYVDDVVDGLIALMNNPLSEHQIFNIGSPIETNIYDLYSMGVEISGREIEIIRDIDKKIETRLPDISKAEQILGWYPKVSLREGLLKTWEYYGSNNR